MSRSQASQLHSPRLGGPQRDLVLVTAGLELDGGGRALVGRLLAQAGAAYAAERGIGFEVLSLGREGLPGTPLPLTAAAGSRRALAGAVFRRQLRRHPPALLFDLLGLSRVQALLPGMTLAPYGVMLHGIELWRPLSFAARRSLRRARQVISISRHTLERGQPFLPALPRPPVLMPLALEERGPEGTVDHELLARMGRGFLLIVGRMAATERYKGHDELLAALALPDHSAIAAAKLVVAGDGDDRPRLEALAASLGVGDRVTFTGFVSEATLAELYRAASALVMVSRGEGFGLVYLEAMRAGKPAVGARNTAAAEVIVDGTTGLLVPAENPPALARALHDLLASPGRAAALGEAGRQRFAAEFTSAAFYQRLVPHLDTLTGQS